MASFGEFKTDGLVTQYFEIPSLGLALLGSTLPIVVFRGPANLACVRLLLSIQSVSGRVPSPLGWDTSEEAGDVVCIVVFALNGAVTPGTELTLDFDYQYVESGLEQGNILSPQTNIQPVRTITFEEGFIDGTLYRMAFTLDRNDPDNGYAGRDGGQGGFSFNFGRALASDLTAIDVISCGISYPMRSFRPDIETVVTS